MRKNSFFITILVYLIFGLISNAHALLITGTPTANGDTTPVGTQNGSGEISFYIPLGGSTGVYGVSGYGESSDSAPAQIAGPRMDMYLLFNVPVGYSGHTLELAFTDLDLATHNDPDHFFERLILYGQGGLPNDTFVDYTDGNVAPYVTSANKTGSLLTFTGLNIGPGDSWIHLGLEAYSVGLAEGRWRNTVEKLTPTLEASPVPEPTTMLLFGTGLIGLAGWGRKKFKRN